jgi:hypothetical protein
VLTVTVLAVLSQFGIQTTSIVAVLGALGESGASSIKGGSERRVPGSADLASASVWFESSSPSQSALPVSPVRDSEENALWLEGTAARLKHSGDLLNDAPA